MANGKFYTSEAEAQASGIDTTQRESVSGTNVELGTGDSKIIYNPKGSSLNQAAQAAGFASAAEARAKGYNLVDTYKAPSIVTSDKVKEDVDSSVENLDQMTEQMGQTPKPKETDIQSQVDKYMAESPEANAVAEANAQIEATMSQYNSQLDQYKATMAENHQGIMDGIKASYDRRIKEMEVFNQNMLGGKQLRGVRTGRQRYARDMQADIISKEEVAGLKRINILEQMMQQELLAAQQAFDSNNLSLLAQQTETLTNLYNQKRQAALDLANLASDQERKIMDRAKFNMEMTKFEDEQAEKFATNFATGLVDIDDEGNIIEPTTEEVYKYAEENGIDPIKLLGSVNSRIDEMKKMSREEQKGYLEMKKLQQEVANYGMSDLQQEYEYAVSNYGYTGNMFDFMQDKETSKMSPYELLKQQIEIQNLQTGGQDFDTFTANGKTYAKFDDGTTMLFEDLFPDEKLKKNAYILADANEQFEAIEEMIKSQGMRQAVGASPLSRGAKQVFVPGSGVSPLEVLTGSKERKRFIGEVSQLTKQLTLKNLIESKNEGATFGALSDTELKMLADAASTISNWEMKDGENIVGWDIDEATFKDKLREIQEYFTKIAKRSAGVNYINFQELANQVPEDELLDKLQNIPGETIEEKRNNILQWYNQSDFNQVGNTSASVSQIKDFSKVNTAFGEGIATGIEAGSKLWKYGYDLVLSGGKGAPVKTPFTGEVVSAKNDGAWGNSVKIKKPNGEIVRLSHLNSINVKPGQKISYGTVIGGQGNTGQTYGKTGIHLDITVYKPDGTPYTSQEVASMFNTKLS